MGATKSNPDKELVVDYANGRHFLRLHLDLNLSKNDFNRIKNILDSQGIIAGKNELKTLLDKDAHPYIDLFFQT